jgi:CRISPR/Cas system-associated exonuclease Cas4 (RecB family)
MSLELDIHPNDIAERLTGRDYISYSGISTFQSCPLKWYFRYFQGLPEDTVSSSLIFGGAIHQAAEFHFRELLAGNPAPDLDTLLAEYQEAWKERDLNAVKFSKGEDVNTLGSLAERVLVAFQQSPFAQPEGTIVGIEEGLRGQLSPDCPDLLARIDLLVDEGDALVVTDLKTARARWSKNQAEDSAEQLLLYSELVNELFPGKPLRLQFAVVTKTKNPVLETYSIAVDSDRVRRTKRVVERTWKAIQAGHIYPAPSPMNCGGCPYREPCRLWTG